MSRQTILSEPEPETCGIAGDPLPQPSPPAPEEVPPETPPEPHRHLPLWVRVGLFVVGWLLVLVGIAGLVLPGIQGVLTILVGAALLSLVSEIAYTLLQKSLRRWPRAWDRVERFRDRTHEKLHRWFHRDRDPD